MAQASIAKRMRQTKSAIRKASGSKRERYEQKLGYLNTLNPGTRFFKGPKQQGEGGYR